MKELDSYILSELAKINQTKEEYTKECEKCFLEQSEETQDEIRNASTEDLEYAVWLSTTDDFKKALKYELMLRTDFEIRI